MLRWARDAVTQPISRSVAADDTHFLESKGAPRLALRLLRRRLELALSGQARSECTRIDPRWKRALWLHVEAPQIGDALMDLAPRSLLAEHGIAVDLLAAPAITALFSGDAGFRRLLRSEADIDPAAYDFAIVDSRARKALAAKRRRAPALPWLSIRADYLGYDFQRGLLATRRLAEFLGLTLDDAAERRHARQKLLFDDAAVPAATAAPTPPGAPKSGPLQVAIALGGVRAERTYRHWVDVAQQLASRIDCRFTLLGSANARAAADAFVATGAAAGLQVDDQVERSDLRGARRAMQAADLLLCADGGLMHLALTTDTRLLALFDASVDPAWRLPGGFDGAWLRAPGRDVNLIAAEQVATAALKLVGPRQR